MAGRRAKREAGSRADFIPGALIRANLRVRVFSSHGLLLFETRKPPTLTRQAQPSARPRILDESQGRSRRRSSSSLSEYKYKCILPSPARKVKSRMGNNTRPRAVPLFSNPYSITGFPSP